MKIFLLLFPLVVAYWLWRQPSRRAEVDAKESPHQPQDIIACPQCGVHAPQVGTVNDPYCSAACLAKANQKPGT